MSTAGGVPEGYRRTEVGVIPEHWSVHRCNDLCQRIMVGVVIRPSQYYSVSGVPALRSANIREGGIVASDLVYFNERSNEALSKSQIRAGDILTVRTGYPGTSAVAKEGHAGWNCIDIIISRPGKTIDPDFLGRWINSPQGKEQILRNQGGLAQQHFNVGDMQNLLVAVPPLPEQRAIAAALGDVDALLAALDAQIAKQRDLKQATMQQLLTGQTRLPGFSGEWETKRLGDLGQAFGGLTGKTKDDFGRGTASYITFMNVMTNTKIDCSAFERVQLLPNEQQNSAQKGDLFFNGSSETAEELALCSVLTEDVDNVYLNSFCFGFRPNAGAKINGIYLAYYFRGKQGRSLMQILAQGSTRYNLSKSALLQSALCLPAVEEQDSIVSVISDIDAELSALQSRRAKTAALKQSMMQALLTGRIRLVEPAARQAAEVPA